jgi:hypothetical protein
MVIYNNSFTNAFDDSPVQPSNVSFKTYNISTDIALTWPWLAVAQDNVAAGFMSVTTTVASLNIKLPDATRVSNGQGLIFYNSGSLSFNVIDYDGNEIATVPTTPGQCVLLELSDNQTVSGSWIIITLGLGTSSASASALAGNGLISKLGKLNTNWPIKYIDSNYTVQTTDRSRVLVYNGGASEFAFPAANLLGNGFNVKIVNAPDSTGQITLTTTPSNSINDGDTFTIYPGQSAEVNGDGVDQYYIFGYGIETYFAWNINNQPVSGDDDITISDVNASKSIQIFTGVLTGNIDVIYPSSVNVYVISNNSSGPYTLNIKTASGTPFPVSQNQSYAVYCDSVDFHAFPTTINIGDIVFPVGSASEPSITFTDDITTGFYKEAIDTIAITIDGFKRYGFNDEKLVLYFEGTESDPAIAFGIDPSTGIYYDGNGWLTLVNSGSNILSVTDNNQILGNQNSATRPSYAFYEDPFSGMFLYNANQLGFGANGFPTMIMDEKGFIANGNGANTRPPYSFLTSQNSGMYLDSSLNISFSVNGVQIFTVTNQQVAGNNGLVATPFYSFRNNPNTGIYLDGSGNTSVSNSGVKIAAFASSGIVNGINGSATTPSYNWGSATGSGMYVSGTSPVIGNSGSGIAAFASTGINNYISGTNANPSYSWVSAPNTGAFLGSGGSYSIASNNVTVANFVNTQVNIYKSMVILPTSSDALFLGSNGTTTSALKFLDLGNTNSIDFRAPNAVTPQVYVLPASPPTAASSTLVSTNGGAMSWSAVNNVQVAVRTNTTTNILSNTTSIIPFDTVTLNNGGTFNTGSYYFQPSVAGVYEISVTTQFSSTPNLATQIALIINKNATPVLETAVAPQGFNSLSGTILVQLSTSDQVQAIIDNSNSTSITQNLSYFNAYLVSR